jgi:large subunit ribosomal protein L15
MELFNLEAPKRKSRKRLGRGPASGQGGTSGRGHKGQKSRTGSKTRAWFEGGQMPLQRRVPKRGFKNPNRVAYSIVNVGDLSRFDKEVTRDKLRKSGVVKKGERIKILGNGNIKKSLVVEADKCSKKAREKIEKAGGRIVSNI